MLWAPWFRPIVCETGLRRLHPARRHPYQLLHRSRRLHFRRPQSRHFRWRQRHHLRRHRNRRRENDCP